MSAEGGPFQVTFHAEFDIWEPEGVLQQTQEIFWFAIKFIQPIYEKAYLVIKLGYFYYIH